MTSTESLQGIVEKILFQNAENGFTVFVLHTNGREIVVKGSMPTIHAGEQVAITGSWITHQKFGKQFEATSCTTHAPSSILGLKKYLASGLIKGIGPVYAEKLVAAFGTDVLEIIDKHPERLHSVPGIGEKRVQIIVTAWQDQKEISHIMVFLQEKGISTAYATKIYKKYGNNAMNVVIENPYRLAEEIWGIGFKIADQIAQNMGFAKDSLKRIHAGILFCLSNMINAGSLYIQVDELKEKAIELLELPAQTAAQKMKVALHDLYNNQKIKLISFENQHFITLTPHYFAEKGVAQKINELKNYPEQRTFDINAAYNNLRTSTGPISLNEDQQAGILACLQNKITIITGGPGTGKTTLIKTLLETLDTYKQVYRLAAPTGRAAKRMSEGTQRPAETVHRLLEFDVSSMRFTRNEQNALKLDFLILDEASMIDIFLAHAILKALPFNAHLVLLGDVNQLPPVGAGNFLHDLIASKIIPCIRLTKIFRQAQDSLIIINAHRINNGEFPTSSMPDARKDFIFIKEDVPENVPTHLQHILCKVLPKLGIRAADTTILVPMNRGTVGTHKLNDTLQQILNPTDTPKKINHTGVIFKVGDRVMQIRNNYDKNVFNGDIGIIHDIDLTDRVMHVQFDYRPVAYEFTDLDELVLAYAISIHKSQGSEYEATIIPIFMQHFTLLQRNLIYTAITRAKKLCIFIGQTRAIAMAIKNNSGTHRTTFLPQFLTTDLTCR
jgi:exodeoxyribonuclease V alpha subunit